MQEPNHLRNRMVCLTRNGDKNQAAEACAALRGIKGVEMAEPVNHHRLRLTYSLEDLTFELIEALLKELGYYLDNSIFAIIRRNIYQYLEDNAREKFQLGKEHQALICDIDVPKSEPEKYWNNYR